MSRCWRSREFAVCQPLHHAVSRHLVTAKLTTGLCFRATDQHHLLMAASARHHQIVEAPGSGTRQIASIPLVVRARRREPTPSSAARYYRWRPHQPADQTAHADFQARRLRWYTDTANRSEGPITDGLIAQSADYPRHAHTVTIVGVGFSDIEQLDTAECLTTTSAPRRSVWSIACRIGDPAQCPDGS